jgi:predicted 2-oxoglutarate/Fe(II)-dependent dioxygenase YbiX
VTQDSSGSTAAVLSPGDPAPWFVARSSVNPQFNFDTLAGRYVVLCFLGSGAHPAAGALLAGFARHADLLDGRRACLFAVSMDPADADGSRSLPEHSWLRWFHDDGRISRGYGVMESQCFRPQTMVLDERLRLYATLPFGDPERHGDAVAALLGQAPAPGEGAGGHAPVLIIPRVFEPELCQRLIAHYEEGGSRESGFMSEQEGRTVGVFNDAHKRRRDKLISDEGLRTLCRSRIERRVVPEVARAFQFQATRLERHLVACYDAETGGHFAPHRDNTTSGTAHRRIAISVVLNSGAFEGGQLCFPEYGPSTYSPPAGGAVVFSCSVLHQATRVTAGRRYCYLPFLFNEEGEAIRQRNLHRLEAQQPPDPQGASPA